MPDEAWAAAPRAAPGAGARLPPGGAWVRLRAAATAGEVGATVLLALLVLGEAGPADADAIVLAEVVTALRRVALDDSARRIALEAVMARTPEPAQRTQPR